METGACCSSPTQTRCVVKLKPRISIRIWVKPYIILILVISSPTTPSIRPVTTEAWVRWGAQPAPPLSRNLSVSVRKCTVCPAEPNPRKKAKDIQKRYVKKHVQHQSFVQILKNTSQIIIAKFRTFQSTNHVLNTIEMTKLCLSAMDDKREIRVGRWWTNLSLRLPLPQKLISFSLLLLFKCTQSYCRTVEQNAIVYKLLNRFSNNRTVLYRYC